MLKQRGISFTPDEKWIKAMEGEGVEPKVIAALRAAKVLPPSARQVALQAHCARRSRAIPTRRLPRPPPTHEGLYGVPCIVHCCLETHGSASEWSGSNDLTVHISTQNLSGIAAQMAEPLNTPAANIRVLQQNIGGGFGSKFAADRWDIVAAKLSKSAGGKPVKMMLARDEEFEVAGMRPSAYARVKIAADKSGKLVGVAVELLGHRWNGRRWHSADPVHLRGSQPAQTAHGHHHQPGQRSRLARAQPSPGRAHHHGGVSRTSRRS